MDQIMGGGTVYFYHGQTTDGYRFTIAGRFQPMLENDNESDVIMLGLSLCSGKDQFAKKVGRIRSEGRMKSKGMSGRNYFSLYQETRPLNWFEGQEQKVFMEAAQLNQALNRAKLMQKFNL